MAHMLADSPDRDAMFVEYRTACGRTIGICGYTVVPEDERTCCFISLVTFMYVLASVSVDS